MPGLARRSERSRSQVSGQAYESSLALPCILYVSTFPGATDEGYLGFGGGLLSFP